MMGKKKEPFGEFFSTAAKPTGCLQRQTQQSKQFKKRPRPEIPQRPQQRGEQRKKQRRAHDGGEDAVKPQLSPADAKRKHQSGERQRDAVERVQRAGEPAGFAPPQAQGAQQIIDQRKRHAQQHRRRQRPGLIPDDRAHGSAAEQAREQPAAVGNGAILVAQRVHPPVHVQLAAVQT